MFLEMGYRDDDAMEQDVRGVPALAGAQDASRRISGVVRDGPRMESIAAGVGLWLMDWPPHMIDSGPRRGNILNVYTRPQSRRLGLARRLMETALAWCRHNGVRAVILHASADGRPLYESLGFKSTNEMRLEIR